RISELLRESGFTPGAFSVTPPKDVDTKSSPTLAARKDPIYTRLTFSVQAPGELKNIVDFLERFYETPLLHGIKTISIRRPQTSGPQQRPGELDFTLTIDALIITGVDSRPQVLPNLNRRLLLIDALTGLRGSASWLTLAGQATGPGSPL